VGGWVGGGECDRACVCAAMISAQLACTHILSFFFFTHSFSSHSSTHARIRERVLPLAHSFFSPESLRSLGPCVSRFVRSQSVKREGMFLNIDFSLSLSLSSSTGSTGLRDKALTCDCVCPCLCVGGADVAAMVFQEIRKRLRRHFFQVRRLHRLMMTLKCANCNQLPSTANLQIAAKSAE